MNKSKTSTAITLVAGMVLCVSCGAGGNSSAGPANAQRAAAAVPVVETTKVISGKLSITARLPGELQPYEAVSVYPKVTAFVDWIGVDRGSLVKTGQVMARLVAPEIAAQRAEAQSKLQGAEATRVEAAAKLASDESTYQRLKTASATPGVVSGNDLEVAQRAVEGDRARLEAARESAAAAKEALTSITEIEGYLQVRAPFDGVVTERNVHPGALVGAASGSGVGVPIVRVEKTSRLRLLVPVPEKYVAGVTQGAKVEFSVPAFPNQAFSGRVARIAHSVDVKTRTMPVELDVTNTGGRLASGMFPEVLWPVRRPTPTLFVPASSVARTTEAIFVVRIRGDKIEWVNVQTGEVDGKRIEVFGDLRAGDDVAVRGTDELRPGTHVTAKQSPADSS
ncbi:MAG TPA: efflux RND transporter periplasmic adaptor subunit [Candidatus Acidoferrales bacterium]|nr:efflux RND transporter periplasmic adaptor subunit [Candidatus Acidoferrales bacterium]